MLFDFVYRESLRKYKISVFDGTSHEADSWVFLGILGDSSMSPLPMQIIFDLLYMTLIFLAFILHMDATNFITVNPRVSAAAPPVVPCSHSKT